MVNPVEWQLLGTSLGLKPDASSLNLPKVRQAVLERIALQTKSFARYATPRAVYLTLQPWTIENTFMTPTLKLKRNNLIGHYASEIEGLYVPDAR